MLEEWFHPSDPPNPDLLFRSPDQIGSWELRETIWTPSWKDTYPPMPLLCSTWGGLGDLSRIEDWADI
jgi:hypothetical protein